MSDAVYSLRTIVLFFAFLATSISKFVSRRLDITIVPTIKRTETNTFSFVADAYWLRSSQYDLFSSVDNKRPVLSRSQMAMSSMASRRGWRRNKYKTISTSSEGAHDGPEDENASSCTGSRICRKQCRPSRESNLIIYGVSQQVGSHGAGANDGCGETNACDHGDCFSGQRCFERGARNDLVDVDGAWRSNNKGGISSSAKLETTLGRPGLNCDTLVQRWLG